MHASGVSKNNKKCRLFDVNEAWVWKDDKLVCSDCGIPQSIGAPNFGRNWISLNGNFYGLNGFERSQMGYEELYDTCICKNVKLRDRVSHEEYKKITQEINRNRTIQDELSLNSRWRNSHKKTSLRIALGIILLIVIF
jgi:hypothetical protein